MTSDPSRPDGDDERGMQCQTRSPRDRSWCGANRSPRTTVPTPSHCKTTATWCWPRVAKRYGPVRPTARMRFVPRCSPTAISSSTRPTNRCGTPTPRARRTSSSCFRTTATWCSTPPPAPEAAATEETAAAEEAVVEEPVAEAAKEPAAEPEVRTYTVESGDSLWAIAERFYGDGSKYQVIADASGIPNPDLIQPGQVLTIP